MCKISSSSGALIDRNDRRLANKIWLGKRKPFQASVKRFELVLSKISHKYSALGRMLLLIIAFWLSYLTANHALIFTSLTFEHLFGRSEAISLGLLLFIPVMLVSFLAIFLARRQAIAAAIMAAVNAFAWLLSAS